MRLATLDLNNFRQFYGQQRIEFAPGSPNSRNVTAFHGFNGSGKTALLNAFVWCLYGELTPDLDNPDRLVNEKAFAEAAVGTEVVCSVSLQFEFRGETFRVERSADLSKTGDASVSRSRTSLQVMKTDPSGQTEPVGREEGARQHRIEQMLPRSLYRFFFFNGERVEQLARPDAYENIESGVKTLLDIEVYERGAEHLRGPVTKALAEEAKRAGDSELAEVAELFEKRNEEKNRLLENNTERESNRRALEEEVEKNERRQEQLRDVAQLANRRKRIREEQLELQGQLDKENKVLAALVSKSGYLAFGISALDATEAQVSAARRKGDLPAKIKPQFVDDLIAHELCVCGRPIHPDSAEARALEQYRSTTGLAELEERIGAISADVRTYRDRREEMRKGCDSHLEHITNLLTKLRTCQEDLSAINAQIAEGDFGEEAARIQGVITQRREEILKNSVAIERNKDKYEEIESAIADLHEQSKNLKTQSDKAALAKRQLDAVQRVATAFIDIRDIQREDVRLALDQQVREIWSDAAIKDYEASVSSQYQLLLTKIVGGQKQPVMGASTGEKQVLALSFVGAMVKKAQDNVARPMPEGIEGGGFFPLVMDSPFGSLEEEYRSKVATWLPKLADQVIVMASKSQWRNEVESAMRPRVGREYILELHTSKKGVGHSVVLDGKEHPYVVSTDDEAEMTIIRRIK